MKRKLLAVVFVLMMVMAMLSAATVAVSAVDVKEDITITVGSSKSVTIKSGSVILTGIEGYFDYNVISASGSGIDSGSREPSGKSQDVKISFADLPAGTYYIDYEIQAYTQSVCLVRNSEGGMSYVYVTERDGYPRSYRITVTREEDCKHVYDNDCDEKCNNCSAKRSTSHNMNEATCESPATCSVCGYTSGKKLGHEYKTVMDKATFYANGSYVEECSRCGDEKNKQVIYKVSLVELSETSYDYDGSVHKPGVSVYDSQGSEIASKYYSISYESGCRNAGEYEVTVTMKDRYSGKETLSFTINPVMDEEDEEDEYEYDPFDDEDLIYEYPVEVVTTTTTKATTTKKPTTTTTTKAVTTKKTTATTKVEDTPVPTTENITVPTTEEIVSTTESTTAPATAEVVSTTIPTTESTTAPTTAVVAEPMPKKPNVWPFIGGGALLIVGVAVAIILIHKKK